MHISMFLMEQIVELFIMIFMGFAIVKAGIVKDEESKVLSKIVLYLVIPCVIVNAFQVDYTAQTVKGLMIAFVASVILQIILLIIVAVMGKVLSLNEVEVASVYYSNSGNLIVPIVTFILGKEWVLYGCVFMSVQLVFIWTHCKKIISRESVYDWRKIVLNINIIAIIIGICLFMFQLQLPSLLVDTFSKVGSMMGPLAMIVIGMLIGEMDLRSIFVEKRTYLISLFRLVVFPLIMILIFKFTGMSRLTVDADKILLITILAASAPPAATITQFAQLYNKHPGYASIMNVMGVIFSIITMPFMIMIYQLL